MAKVPIGEHEEISPTYAETHTHHIEEIVDLTTWQLAGLYTSHSLSMWNSRSYEYASVLFIASAYPETLVVASLRGMSANLAGLLFSPSVGRWCNRHPSRLWTLQVCIVVQRMCICVACLGWLAIVQNDGVDHQHQDKVSAADDEHGGSGWMEHAITGILLLLGAVEKLSAVGNEIVMERDWVPSLATATTKPALHVLNAGIKRVDLVCHLIAPLAVAVVALQLYSLRWTALVIAGMQMLSCGPELMTAKRLWMSSSSLQRPRKQDSNRNLEMSGDEKPTMLTHKIMSWTHTIRLYTNSPACLPSVAWALQPFSVLTLSASMTVYLLAAGYPLSLITAARALSTIVELASTIITPLLVSRLSLQHGNRYTGNLKSLIKVGLWGLCWQLATLLPAVMALLLLPPGMKDLIKSSPVLSAILLIFLALSRLGPFAYSLVEQQLVQTIVPEEHRITFSGVEMALISLAELSRWGMTGIFGKPEQFKYVAVASLGVVMVSTALFWLWTRGRRKQVLDYELVAMEEVGI